MGVMDMAGRPGLYAEVVRVAVMKKATEIALGAGTDLAKADALQQLMWDAGSRFEVSARAAFIFRHRLIQGGAPLLQTNSKKGRNQGGQRGNKNALGNRGGVGPPPGNHHATTTGERADPRRRLLLSVAAVEQAPPRHLDDHLRCCALWLRYLRRRLERAEAAPAGRRHREERIWLLQGAIADVEEMEGVALRRLGESKSECADPPSPV